MFSGSSSTQQILADCTSIPRRAACLRCTHYRQRGAFKSSRWEPHNHPRSAHLRASVLLCALGGEGTQPTLPPLCGWGMASCRKWLSKLKEEGEAPASGELAFRFVAGRGETTTWFISVLSLEDVLLIPAASTVYFN